MTKHGLISFDQVAVGVAIVSIGLTIAIGSLGSMQESSSKYQSAKEYKDLLKNELSLNEGQAEAVIELDKKNTNPTLQPNYQTSVYNSGLYNGLFYKLDKETRYAVSVLYAITETDNNSISSANNEDKAGAIRFQAIKFEFTIEKFLANEVKVNKYDLYQCYAYFFLTLLGVGMTAVGVRFASHKNNKVKTSSIKRRIRAKIPRKTQT